MLRGRRTLTSHLKAKYGHGALPTTVLFLLHHRMPSQIQRTQKCIISEALDSLLSKSCAPSARLFRSRFFFRRVMLKGRRILSSLLRAKYYGCLAHTTNFLRFSQHRTASWIQKPVLSTVSLSPLLKANYCGLFLNTVRRAGSKNRRRIGVVDCNLQSVRVPHPF